MWQKTIELIKIYLASATARDSGIMLFGAALATVLGFLLTVILARGLTPVELGLIFTALTFTQLISDMFELGVNPASLNFISSAEGHEKLVIIKTTFLAKLGIALSVGVGVFLLANPLAAVIFRSEAMVPFIQISSIGVVVLMLIGWEQTVFQAEKRFFSSMLVGSSINILRVLAVLGIILLGVFSGVSSYIALQVVLPGLVVFFLFRVGRNFLRVSASSLVSRKVLKFGLPVGIGFAAAAVYSKLDQILIFNFLGGREAGIYGLSFRVMSVFLAVVMSLNAAVTPRFASIGPDEFLPYFKKVVFAAFGLGLVSVLVILVSPMILPLIFGPKFYDSIVPFQILSVGAIFFALSSPFYNAILYRFKKPKFALFLSLLSLLLMLGLLNFLIPLYKNSGAALSVALVYGLQLILSVGYFTTLNRGQVR